MGNEGEEKVSLERNMMPLLRKLLPCNSVTVTVPFLAKVSHRQLYLILQGSNGFCSAPLTDVAMVEPDHTSPRFAGLVWHWTVVV